MDLVASFSSQRVNTFNFFSIRGILGDNSLVFLFDTGAACPVVGVNSFFREGRNPSDRKIAFEEILKNELTVNSVKARPLKAANNQQVMTYPCICHNVSIENTAERDFYFDISFDEISIPLLGSSFIDDCAYSHAIKGNIAITGVRDHAGADYYKGYPVLDFDVVAQKYQKKICL